ncbi:MAG: flagellar basal body-associated FliL family protein [Rhodobacteraceae bacterium]|jgi:flagellar FliL protein|nr:flagellar basal body-associated FliL family protein [Paracoccaceae bacterium]
MADAQTKAEDAPAKKKGGKLGLVLGLVLALVLGGGGFYAVHSGMILAPAGEEEAAATEGPELPPPGPLPGVAFVPVDPLVVNLGAAGSGRHLRFRAQLEVKAEHTADVTLMLPRVTDVLNGYLRAVDVEDLADPLALQRLRAQMLRRVQVVTGEGRVRDLLIMEFVLS